VNDAANIIETEHLFRVFGQVDDRVWKLIEQGHDKESIFERTGATVAVRDASFTIRTGEIFVVMGLSGCGKSTLLRMLNRLVEPTRGSVRVDGREVTTLSRAELIQLRRTKLSMVFQSFALLPHLSVEENVAFGLDVSGVSRAEQKERAARALSKVGLEQHKKSHPQELSGGMQQRVGLARALATEASVLLMDEAFSALDPLIRTQMQDHLLAIQAETGRTIVFISHDLDEAMRIGDRIAIMDRGRIVQTGTPLEILAHPADDFVRSFFRGVDTLKFYRAGDVATLKEALVAAADGAVEKVLAALKKAGREVAFLRADDDRFGGVVTERSLLAQLETEQPRLAEAVLDVSAVPAREPLGNIVSRVADSPVPLPIVDDGGKLVGVLSRAAVLRALGPLEGDA
jgi:glycine betaine/proline transport system ATP-binding protein